MGITIDITDFTPITVSQLEITSWLVDLDRQKVVATIRETDAGGVTFKTFEVTFWATMPTMPEILDFTDPQNPVLFDPPQYEPTPETWYALPADNLTELVVLTNAILVAIKARLY